jgi:hypothetical protein
VLLRIEGGHFIEQIDRASGGSFYSRGHHVEAVAPGVAKQNAPTIPRQYLCESAQHLALKDRELWLAQLAEPFHVAEEECTNCAPGCGSTPQSIRTILPCIERGDINLQW